MTDTQAPAIDTRAAVTFGIRVLHCGPTPLGLLGPKPLVDAWCHQCHTAVEVDPAALVEHARTHSPELGR